MKRNTKRFLSLFLTVPMTFSLMAVPVGATPSEDPAAVEAEAQTQEEAAPEISDAETETAETVQDTADETEETQDAAGSTESETPAAAETDTDANSADGTTVITVQDSLTTFTLDASKIEEPEVNVNEMQLTEEELAAVDESDPEIITVKEELDSITVLNADGESVPLTEEQKQTVIGMFSQYQQQWRDNADLLGVQNPFYLQFNDNEDGLGVLGEMLILAGKTVDQVRSGEYSYNDLTGMIMNFLYGDMYGIEYYSDIIRAKRNEALETVEASGAKTDAQKFLVLNTWIAQNNSFDMSFIMNQMDEEPIMAAEEPQEHEHYAEMKERLTAVYKEQLTTQFRSQYRAGVEAQYRQNVYEAVIKQLYMQTNEGATEEDANAYIEENSEAIQNDALGFITENYGEEAAASAEQQADATIEQEDANIEATVDNLMENQPVEELGGMTANEAIPIYAEQAGAGLAEGILGYWEGNHIGALAESKSVCMGYAKAFAYLVQCMYPEIYLKEGETDIDTAANWKTASDLYYDADGNLDITQNYNVDLVRITFDASVKMYGIPQPDFNSDHFWNAVKVDGNWYYVDPCYTDVFSEVMNRDRVETNGYMNHTYFMISHSSLAEMFDGNYKEIKSLYYVDGTDYTSSDYEGSWVSRVVSNVYSDGTYIYYMYDSTDLLETMRQFDNSYTDVDIEESVYKIVRHQIDEDDKGDGDTDYETLIDFNSGDSATVNGEANELLTGLYAQFVEEQDVYPAIHTTPVLYNGKLYFNVSNSILSYDIEAGTVELVKEYNTVSISRDKTVVFAGMGFNVVDDAESADFTFENRPIAGMALKNDGSLYVDIATNLSYIAGKDRHDYADKSSYGYEFEESNYNPDYSTFTDQMMADQGITDDQLEQMGYKKETNDNSEFMWVANATDKLEMSHFAGDSHEYAEVSVDAYCGRDAFTENRCTTCGAIEAESRVTAEGTACDHHHYLEYNEEYYTTSDTVTSETDPDTVNWNTGVAYVCAACGFHIDEPTEPRESNYDTDEEYQAALAEYEEEKAIYDDAVATAGHTYEPTDAEWSEDSSTVTFSALQCSSSCPENQTILDVLIDTAESDPVAVTLDEAVTAEAEATDSEGSCEDGVTLVYTASGEVTSGEASYTYTAKNKVQQEAGSHNYVGEFTWTETTDEEGNKTGYTAIADVKCSVCKKTYEDVEAVVEKDEENSAEPTYEADGKDVYVATATVTDEDGNTIASVTETREDILPMLICDHNYEGTFVWVEVKDDAGNVTGYTATATVTCTAGCEATYKDVPADVVKDDDNCKAPTYHEEGKDVYIATATVTDEDGNEITTVTETKEFALPMLICDHEFASEFTWTEVTDEEGNVTDYTATATFKCPTCGDTYEDVEADVVKDETNSVAPGYDADGKDVYVATATVTDEEGNEIVSASESKEVVVPMLICDHEFTNEFTWTEVTDEEGNVTDYTATATFKCSTCGDTYEDVEADVVKDAANSVAPNYEADGKDVYIATATVTDEEGNEIVSASESKEVVLPMLICEHKYEGVFTWTEVKDEEGNVTEYTATADVTCKGGCGKTYEDVPAEVVKDDENSVPAEELSAGKDVYIATATVTEDGETIATVTETKEVVLPALGCTHEYAGEITWAEETDENGSVSYTATATITCSKCGTTYENVPAEVVRDEDNSVSATYEEEGKDVYIATATVTDEEGNVVATVTDTKEVTVPKLVCEHEFESSFVWSEVKDEEGNVIGYTATATFTCQTCNETYENVAADVVKDEDSCIDPTYDTEGKDVYVATATVTDEEGNVIATASDTKEVAVPALICEHNFTGEFEWVAVVDENGMTTGYTATATATCSICEHVYEDIEATVALDEEASVAPTCEAGGTNVYTATAEIKDADGNVIGTVTDTREDAVEATGHNYVDGVCTACGAEEPTVEAPVVLSAYSKEQTSVKVTWSPVDGAYGYELWRAESMDASADEWTKTKTVLADNAQMTEDGNIYYRNVELTEGVTYYYKVRAFSIATGSEYSAEDTSNRLYSDFSEVKYMPATVLLGDIYSAATNKVRLNWTEVGGAHGYQIWRLDEENGEYKIVKTLGDRGNELTNNQGATTAYSNVDLEAGKTYTYKIRAFMIPGDGTKVFGAYSDEFTVAVMPESTTIAVSATKAGDARITWDAVNGAAGYQIWMRNGNGEYAIAKVITDGTAESYIKGSLSSGTTYRFKIRAYTEVNGKKTFGEYSNEVSFSSK